MAKGKVFIISGPSGSGKTTLYKKLMASAKLKNKLARSISVTTRPKRSGEKHGRDYLFVSLKKFMYKKRQGHFLEHEKVFDNFYGTPNKGIRELLRAKKNVLLCIDVNGARTVKKKIPEAVTIFIKAPTIDALKDRLKKRGSEHKKIMRIRLKTAQKELKEAKHYNYVIINDHLNSAYNQMVAIISSEIDSGSSE